MDARDQIPDMLHWQREDCARDAVVIVALDADTKAACRQCGAPAAFGAGYHGTDGSDMPPHQAVFEGSFYGCTLRHLVEHITERVELFPKAQVA